MEFIKYEATPKEKHLGIATVKLYGKILLRFKIVPTKDGQGYFSTPAYIKTEREGEDKFIASFVIDSRTEEDELNTLIRDEIRKFNPLGNTKNA